MELTRRGTFIMQLSKTLFPQLRKDRVLAPHWPALRRPLGAHDDAVPAALVVDPGPDLAGPAVVALEHEARLGVSPL